MKQREWMDSGFSANRRWQYRRQFDTATGISDRIGVFDVYIESAVAGPFEQQTETSIYSLYARQALTSLSVLKVAILLFRLFLPGEKYFY